MALRKELMHRATAGEAVSVIYHGEHAEPKVTVERETGSEVTVLDADSHEILDAFWHPALYEPRLCAPTS